MTTGRDELELSPFRQLAERRLGPLTPYLLHLRPAEWPIMAAHTTLGWWLASGLHRLDFAGWLGVGTWVIALNGGTLALNSAFDHDTGDIAFLRRPPAPPRGLGWFALGLMVFGFGLTWALPLGFRVCYAICLVMSILYSVPPVRLKAVAGADWVINMLGFGTLSPYAGWLITGQSIDLRHHLIFWAFAPLFGALYPLTQLYQMDEDRSRGDRTLVLRIGARASLTLAMACAAVAFGMIVVAGLESHWGGWRGILRWTGLWVALVSWGAVLLPWRRNARLWSTREHQTGMYHALWAWALTDVAVLLAWAL
jgi:4-hydroxybenzoate polyprenyltransferase